MLNWVEALSPLPSPKKTCASTNILEKCRVGR